jgi:ParB/RepB/Spo0J family partition protein
MRKNRGHRIKGLARIPVSSIQDISFIPKRSDMGDLVELAKVLRERGDVDVPIKVRPKGSHYELVWGYRRVAAAMLAGLKEISAIIEDINDKEVMVQHLMENMFRKDRNPIEEAELFEACKRILNKTYDEIARMLGIKREYIYNRVELLKLAEPVREFLKKISSATNSGVLYMGRLLLKVADPNLQYKLVREAVRSNLSVRELKKLIDDTVFILERNSNKLHGRHLGKSIDIVNLTQYSMKNIANKCFDVEIVNEINCNRIKYRKISFITHAITHIDTPKLLYKDGKCIEEYNLDYFQPKAFVVQVSKNNSQPITSADLPDNIEWQNIQCLLISTGFSKLFGSDVYYEQHPYLSNELCQLLIRKGIKLVGIDASSVDVPYPLRREKFHHTIHMELLKNDVLIIENLGDMSKVKNCYVNLVITPILLMDIDEVPASVIAIKSDAKRTELLPLQKS